MAKKVKLVNELHAEIAEEVLPLLAHAGLVPEARKSLAERYLRLGNEQVSAPWLVEMRTTLGEVRRAIGLIGVDEDDVKKPAQQKIAVFDAALMALHQYLS